MGIPRIRGWKQVGKYKWRHGNWLEARVDRVGKHSYEAVGIDLYQNKILASGPFDNIVTAKNSLISWMKYKESEISKITKDMGLR